MTPQSNLNEPQGTLKNPQGTLKIPECPLEYEVPYIPGTHTALVISINAADIDWQEKILPWTLASLINNTDLVMKGVHLYIVCEDGTEARIQNALSLFDLPQETIREDGTNIGATYDTVYIFDINCWAFRDESNAHKLNFTGLQSIKPYPPISDVSPSPIFYDMTHCTAEQFRHAMKQLMGSQLAMKV